MASFYRRCGLFVLSSRMEGFPLPPLEAMACGCAVLTTACGGTEEYAVSRVNAWVVPPAKPSEMARAIRILCADPHLRKALALEGKKTAARYGEKEGLERLLRAVEGRLPGGKAVVS